MSYDSTFEDLMDRAEDAPYGDLRYALYQEALALAQASGDLEDEYRAREQLVDSAVFTSRHEEMAVHLAWCRGISEREPDRFPTYTLIWQHKWLCDNMADHADVSLAMMDQLFADYQSLLELHGYNLRPLRKIRMSLQKHTGDKAAMRECYDHWQDTPRDAQSDCPACDTRDMGWYHMYMGNFRRALTAMDLVLKGRQHCHVEPATCLSMAAICTLSLGWWERALDYIAQTKSEMTDDHAWDTARENLVQAYLMMDQLPEAIRYWCDYADDTVNMGATVGHLFFYSTSAILWARAAEDGPAERPLRVDSRLAFYRESGRYDVAELAAYFAAERDGLAARFDARNGSDAISSWVAAEAPHVARVHTAFLARTASPSPNKDDA